MTCGTCEHLIFENEVLRTRCRSLCAKGLDSRISCHSDVDASKFSSSQPDSTSYSLERESLDGCKCASTLDSSFIATPHLVASSGVAQDVSDVKGASHIFGTHAPKPKFQCIPLCFAFTVSNMGDVCVPQLLRNHVAFLMARMILIWAPSRVLGLMLLALSPKGLLSYKRMVIRPLRPCLLI
jgi:hypothetical protein